MKKYWKTILISLVIVTTISSYYIQAAMEELNLEVTSEFIVMLSTLVYLKSKSLLPQETEDEEEITEEELIRRIIEYKKYKEITKKLRENYNEYSKRIFKMTEKKEKRIEKKIRFF